MSKRRKRRSRRRYRRGRQRERAASLAGVFDSIDRLRSLTPHERDRNAIIEQLRRTFEGRTLPRQFAQARGAIAELTVTLERPLSYIEMSAALMAPHRDGEGAVGDVVGAEADQASAADVATHGDSPISNRSQGDTY